MSGPAVVLRARGVRVERDDREVLHGVDLELRTGEITVLMGPNGAGKSTLLDALCGQLEPASGSVERTGRVALALQSPDLARRSVLDNVMLALAWWGVPRAERRERATEALRALGAEPLAGRAAATLSGGERRRVHLARALALRPDTLLLDEPFAGLDAASRAGLLDDTGAALRSRADATLVVVHDRAEAWALADRLLVLLDGALAADGAPRYLLEQPPTATVARFLGFDGELALPGGERLLTRPHHVVLDPAGDRTARVARALPLEDGLRLELEVDEGRLFALAPLPGPGTGDEVRVRIAGGVRFPAQSPAPADPAHAFRP